MDRPLRWGYVPAAQVVGRVRAAGVAAGTRGSDTAQLDRSADRSRPGRRRRRVFHRRRPRSAVPEPGTARQPRTVVDRAGCGRRFVRGAGLPIAVVAAALGVRRRAHMSRAGTFSISATPAGLLALFSLAVHRPVRQTLLVTALWIPFTLAFAIYSPTTDPLSVLVRVTPLALAVTAWGMFIRARRQLLFTLRERAQRAEADQRLHEDRARMRSEEHTSELQSRQYLVCRLLLEKKKKKSKDNKLHKQKKKHNKRD